MCPMRINIQDDGPKIVTMVTNIQTFFRDYMEKYSMSEFLVITIRLL